MTEPPKFRIAIIGSGPIGKLLLSSVVSHPRIEYVQFESDTLPLRPSFGYGVGPQTLAATMRLSPTIGRALHEKCIITPVWMNFYHGGHDEDLPTIETPTKEYGRIGRQELLDLLDSYRLPECVTTYGKTLQVVTKEDGGVKLTFHDGAEEHVNAVFACDGMNSLCRRIIQGPAYRPAVYSGTVAFRGKVPSEKVTAVLGEKFTETYCFVGVDSWHILIFPIESGAFINIAAFAKEEVQKKRGRTYKTSTEELLTYFPNHSSTVEKLLRLLNEEQEGGCQCLELTTMKTLDTFYNTDLCMISFGDAANGMLPHIAGSMSTGFIGVTTFLHDQLNSRLQALSLDASDEEISNMLMLAAEGYESQHKPLAQKLVDYSWEQGVIFNNGEVDTEILATRPRFLWQSASADKT